MVQTGAQLGPYRLLRRIGSGGMAEVFLAQRIGAEGFSRTVAIKTIIAVGAEDEGIGLFLDEARVAGYLEHPAIVQTVDLGFENETLFIVMEYVPGPALSRMIRDLKKAGRFMPPQVVAYVGARVASALDYAHRRATTPEGQVLRLVHRDISPQNILLTRAGMVKLTDFGVARASIQSHRTRTGQVRGKAAYMAPEQVRAGALDGRTDIFALGLVLYEALTGVRAYQRKTDIMSMRAILTDEVPPIEQANPSAPPGLIAVIKKTLSKKPDDRYPTAQALAEALQETYRAHSEAVIETEITKLITELFGPEQFSNAEEPMPVEAWQPTITAQAGQGSELSPHRLAGAKLSPKIAAMLASSGGRSDSVATPVESWSGDPRSPSQVETAAGRPSGASQEAGSGAGRKYGDRRDADREPPVLRPGSDQATPLAGSPGPSGTPTGTASAIGRDGLSFPGMPVMGQTGARSMLPNGNLAPDPMAFSELFPGTGPSAGGGAPLASALGDTAFGPLPLQPSIVGTPPAATGSLLVTDPNAARARTRTLIWGLVGVGGALVISLGVMVFMRPNERRPQEAPIRASASVSASASAASVHPSDAPAPVEAPTIDVRRVAEGSAAGVVPEPNARIEPGPANPRERVPSRTRPLTGRHADSARHPSANESSPAAAARPESSQTADQEKKKEREAFIRRAIEAKRKAESDPAIAKQLTRLVLDLTAIKDYEIKPEDRELVRRAEGK